MSSTNININLKIRKRKSYFDITDSSIVSRATLFRLKSKLRKATIELNKFYKQFDLELHSVNLRRINSEAEPFQLNIFSQSEQTDKELSILDAVKIKDVVNSSEKKYLKVRETSKHAVPSLDKVRKMTKRLNDEFNVNENEFGFFCSANQKLTFIMQYYLNKDSSFFEDNVVKLKFCADGFQCTKTRRQILNFSFSIIHAKTNAKSIDGHFLLGVFEISNENHDQVSKSIKEIVVELNDLSTIVIDSRTFKIEKYLCCDLKMLSILYGINAANSNQPCIWCEYNITQDKKDNIGEYIHAKMGISRTLKEANRIAEYLEDGLNGYVKRPIINIDFKFCVFDTLHLFLRITDKLFVILFDFIENCELGESDLEKRPMMRRFLDFLNNECKISNAYYLKKKDNSGERVKLRSFNSNELDKIYIAVSKNDTIGNQTGLIRILLPPQEHMDELEVIDSLWFNFYRYYKMMKNRIEVGSIDNLTESLKSFFNLLKQPRFPSCLNLTPYLHILIHHLPVFLETYEDIDLFNLQGFEKLNHKLKQTYERNTNKKTHIYLKQLLSVRNRHELNYFDYKLQ